MTGISRSGDAAPVWISDSAGNVLGTATNPLQISGGGGGSGGGPATIADGADVAEGATTATAYTDRTGAANGTVVSLLKGLFTGFVGNVASGTADSGNPVKIGGVSNTGTPTVLTNGSRGDLWMSANGAVVVAGLQISGGDAAPNTNLVSIVGTQAAGSQRLLTVANSVFNGTTWDRARGDTNGSYAVSKGSGTFATAQAAVTTTAAQIVAARAGRGSVKIQNLGTTDIYLGNTGVTTTTGDLLVGTKGASVTIPTTAAIFAIGAAAGSVSILEVY